MAVSEFFASGLAHAGMHATGGLGEAASQVGWLAAPVRLPDIGGMIEMAQRGWLGEIALTTACAPLGVQISPVEGIGSTGLLSGDDQYKQLWNRYYFATQELPTVAEYFEISNRRLRGDGPVRDGLRKWGFIDPDLREQMENLRYDIPGPSDLVRFGVRHCWEPELLAALGYDAEFPGEIVDYWHAAKGLDYPLFSGPFSQFIDKLYGTEGAAAGWLQTYADAGLPEPTWAKFFWYSHWVLPSPGMGYDFLARLRPDRDRSFDPPEAEGIEFTQRDLNLLLRANDYPLKYRPMLSAIARRMPGVRFIRDFRKQGVYTYANVLEWARRWNYSDRDAKDIADDIERSVQSGEEKKVACKGCATCDQAFEVGILDAVNLAECYVGYGADPKDAGKMSSLAQQKLQVKRARELVGNIRKRFLRGTLDRNQADNLMQGFGIVFGRRQEYLDDWQIELEAGRKELSAGKAVQYACKGIISELDLVNRLANLGYPPEDRESMLLEARICRSQALERAQEKLDRSSWQAKQRQYELCRRNRQILQESQRMLAAHGSPTQLRQWFCDGSISECDVHARLNALSWPDADITKFLQSCKSGRKTTGACPPGQPVVIPECPVPQPNG